MKREGMKAAKALFPPQIRDKAALHALQIVNGDGYKHNLWVRFPDGACSAPKTWFWQDVYSSKILVLAHRRDRAHRPRSSSPSATSASATASRTR
jgi:putative transposase